MKLILSPPNQLTVLRILLTPVFLVLLFSGESALRQWSLLVYIVAALTDWYDGWLARRWGYVTRWGAFLDPFADKVLTSAALIAFVILHIIPAWPVWIIVGRDIIVTGLRSYAEFRGRPFDTSRLAKTKTFTQLVVIYYILILYVARESFLRQKYGSIIDSLLHPTLVYALVVAVAAITLLSGVLYIVGNRSTLRDLADAEREELKDA